MSYTSKFTGAEIDAGIDAAHAAVARSGSAMTGPLLLHDAPTDEKGAATKKYVDDAASAKAYADDKDATNLDAAKKYADEKAGDALSQAKEHANSVVPSTLPNPASLKFTGAANKTYDGSSAVEVEIPTVPSLDGYATETYVNDKVAEINIPSVEGLASEAYVDDKVGAIDVPSALPNPNALTFSGGATGSYDGTNPVNIPIPSVAGLASESYVDDKIAEIDIPSIDGLATTKYVEDKVAEVEHPDTLPNPFALTFTGAASGTYDGSAAVEINIPQGGSSGGGSGLAHIMDGAASGSVRTSGATSESGTYALGKNAFAEGNFTKASGEFSHAEGSNTSASNYAAHAEGTGTIAAGEDQHVQGRFNVEDADSKYLHIVGNGESDNARSNAHTLDANGNAWFRGKVFVGGESMDDPNAKELGGGVTDINELLVKNLGYVIPETTLALDTTTNMMAYTNPLGVTPTEDYTYLVNWNGAEYNCTAMYYEEDGAGAYMVGNLGALDMPGTYVEPFLILLAPDASIGAYASILPFDGSTEATVSVKAVKYSKIPAQCMPEEIVSVIFVNITGEVGDDASGWVADKTFSEVGTAALSGSMVFFRITSPDTPNLVNILPLLGVDGDLGYILFGGAQVSNGNILYAYQADGTFLKWTGD